MILEKSLQKAVNDLLDSYCLEAMFIRDDIEPVLSSASQVNVLIGLTNGVKGNVLLGMTRNAALKISSRMTGTDIVAFNELAQGAISEFMNTLVGMGLGNFSSDTNVNFTSPVLISGDDMYLMISRVESSKLLFTIDGEEFCIAVSVE